MWGEWFDKLKGFITGGPKADFQRRLRAECVAAGLRPDSADEDSAVFVLSRPGGEGIGFGVLLLGEVVRFTAMSNVKFPQRRIPPWVLQACERHNGELRHSRWEVHHGSGFSKLRLVRDYPLAVLEGGVLRAAIEEMLPGVESLDESLREYGFGG